MLYLIFNEGYATTSGDNLICEDLCTESIRLAQVLHKLMTENAEVAGLLVLMV
ncbi:MAG: putative RNA polymerase sigma factor, partial [Candidatus Paceibacteria bacterium]